MCDCCCCTDYKLDCDNINLEEDDEDSECICFEEKSAVKQKEKDSVPETIPTKQPEVYAPLKPKYFTRDEVVIHCSSEDIWIIINKSVYNLTPLIKDRMETMNDSLKLLIAFAGKDLSHYFDEFSKPRIRLTKSGNFVPLFVPTIENVEGSFSKTQNLNWWEDPLYIIGRITESERDIRIINTLTKSEQKMTVCEEDSIYDIIGKYKKKYNHHAGGYTWRKDFKNGTVSGALSFKSTLTQNRIFKEKNNIGPPPSLWLFYNDDFTIA